MLFLTIDVNYQGRENNILLPDMDLQKGKIISHYELIEPLGAGGMSVVYKARDLKLDRHVALKFLNLQVGLREEDKQRFIQEAKTTSALDHPNICTIYEIDETAEGQVFISMAYYQGETLKDKIACGQFPIEEAVQTAIQICEGLAKAHSKGVIHRDVKPANMIITEDGVLKILDFGIAKLKGTKRTTQTGIIMGTPGYMSPEQTRGNKVDNRTDIWSTGVILYEMLTCVLPFRGESDLSLMYSIVHEEPVPVEELREDVPENLRAIIQKALRKNPKMRYGIIEAMLHDLKSLSTPGFKMPVEDESALSPKQPPSIAILPFRDLSPEKDQEYFCDGLAESLLTSLSRVEGLRVVSRNSVFRFKNTELNLTEIREKLQVQTVLEGSIQKAGNRVRIALQLINAEDGFLIWGEDFREELQDIFAIQDKITDAVVDALRLRLIGEQINDVHRHHTENIEAYNAYLKGRFYWNQRTVKGLNRSIEHFTEAIDLDANFALAYAGLADSYTILGIYSAYAPDQVMPRAIDTARRALQLDEHLAEAHISLGCVKSVYEWDWNNAEAEFLRGIELNPNYATAHHWYAINYLVPLSRFNEAMKEINKALHLDPISLVINTTVGLVHYYKGNYDQAIQIYQKALQMQSDFAMANFFLGQTLVQTGEYDRAMENFQIAMNLYGESSNMLANYGIAAALGGETKIANDILKDLLEKAERQYVSSYDIATLLVGLNQPKEAVHWLQRAYDEHAYLLVYLNVDPVLRSLRAKPEFADLQPKIFGETE
ncbi:MAG TPA: tetratricopeptide repeat protein [Caldithrix sp.]|nr:tetratricopeptide repeat protein [Caldithrix sp.]